uniref:Uncharacterized protein n=1 Tax=Arundo donax TaxID=35708 RepID=A0A0A9GAK9_ARUDO
MYWPRCLRKILLKCLDWSTGLTGIAAASLFWVELNLVLPLCMLYFMRKLLML